MMIMRPYDSFLGEFFSLFSPPHSLGLGSWITMCSYFMFWYLNFGFIFIGSILYALTEWPLTTWENWYPADGGAMIFLKHFKYLSPTCFYLSFLQQVWLFGHIFLLFDGKLSKFWIWSLKYWFFFVLGNPVFLVMTTQIWFLWGCNSAVLTRLKNFIVLSHIFMPLYWTS